MKRMIVFGALKDQTKYFLQMRNFLNLNMRKGISKQKKRG